MSDRIQKIYLSGPITLGGTISGDAVRRFVDRFKEEEVRLTVAGYTVKNPCNLPKQDSWEAYMKLAVPMVCWADVVATLPRWRESRGSMFEVFVAHTVGVDVIDVEHIS